MASRCERCGDRYYADECVTCRDAIRALEQALGSSDKAQAIMLWLKSVAEYAVRSARKETK